jgi:hypothetical protein
MIEKDKTILDLIERLKLIINFKDLEIVNYWDADLCAIGFRKNNKLIYISTYNFVVSKIVKYDFDLELMDKLDKTNFKVIKEGRGVSEPTLINELKKFLEV